MPIGGTIVALYLLKRRRREQVVSSVMLWQAAAQDTHADAPFQRLRRHLLLLLQLLIALFLAFTLARPFLWASGLGGRTTAIVLDASASMKATDEPGGRFARAVAAAKALVKRKAPGDQALVVVAAEKPAVLAPLTGDTGKLIRALDGAASKGYPTDVTGDLREAITFAAAQVVSRAGAQVTVLSDGAFGRLDAVALGGAELRFLPVGRRAENVAITAFDVRDTLAGDTRQVFVTLQNFGRSARTLPLEIHVGSNLVAAQEVTLPPGGSKSESFDHIRAGSGGVVTARLDVADDLAADNEASVALPPPRALKILLVSEGNLFLERGLNAGRRVQLLARDAGEEAGQALGHDLTVFDGGAAPKDPPPGRYLFWGGPPSGPQTPAARRAGRAQAGGAGLEPVAPLDALRGPGERPPAPRPHCRRRAVGRDAGRDRRRAADRRRGRGHARRVRASRSSTPTCRGASPYPSSSPPAWTGSPPGPARRAASTRRAQWCRSRPRRTRA